MNFLTKAINYITGQKTTRRPFINNAISLRSFAAAKLGRLQATFTGTDLSINESLKRDLDKMRHRSRTISHDNDYGKKYIRMCNTNIVGAKGVRLQAKAEGSDGKPDQMDNDAIEAAWNDFCKRGNCDVTGKFSMIDVQRIAISTIPPEGEVLIRVVRGAAYKYGVALQFIEADRLDTQLNKEATADNPTRIVMSVELDEFDKPQAYYILTKHPSESVVTFGRKKYLRVPANEMIHLFLSERVAQARGIPWMHTSINRLRMIGGYEEAELTAARVGASKMGFYTTETGDEYVGDGTENGYPIQEAEPGTFEQLPAGTTFEAFDPQHPTGAYNYFLRGTLRGAAAGLGVSYTGFTGDLEAVNYSSIRAGLIEERENWRVLQGWFIEHCMAVIYERWLSMALTRGLIVNAAGVKLPLSKKEKFLSVRWQARGWAWVDPLKDQQANDAAVASGHKTNSEVISAQGNDIEEVYETLAWEKELAKKYGLEFNKVEATADDEEDTNIQAQN